MSHRLSPSVVIASRHESSVVHPSLFSSAWLVGRSVGRALLSSSSSVLFCCFYCFCCCRWSWALLSLLSSLSSLSSLSGLSSLSPSFSSNGSGLDILYHSLGFGTQRYSVRICNLCMHFAGFRACKLLIGRPPVPECWGGIQSGKTWDKWW